MLGSFSLCYQWNRVSDHCHTIAFGTAPSQDRFIMACAGNRLPLLFEFEALKFSNQFILYAFE